MQRLAVNVGCTVHHELMLKRPRGKLLIGSLVLSSAVASLSGCAGGVSVYESANVALIIDSGFLTGDQAAISGTLTVTEAGCVGLADQEGSTFPAVWPRGTTLTSASPVTLYVPVLGIKRQGDKISGTGGYCAVEGRTSLKEVAVRCHWGGEVIGIYFARRV